MSVNDGSLTRLQFDKLATKFVNNFSTEIL